jgi:hypothetical protein
MGTRTGEELLESMRDGRQLFIDGYRVEDVTTDPRFGAGASLSFTTCSTTRRSPASFEPLSALIAAPRGGAPLLGHLLVRPDILALPFPVTWCGELLAAGDAGRTLPARLLPHGQGVLRSGSVCAGRVAGCHVDKFNRKSSYIDDHFATRACASLLCVELNPQAWVAPGADFCRRGSRVSEFFTLACLRQFR